MREKISLRTDNITVQCTLVHKKISRKNNFKASWEYVVCLRQTVEAELRIDEEAEDRCRGWNLAVC